FPRGNGLRSPYTWTGGNMLQYAPCVGTRFQLRACRQAVISDRNIKFRKASELVWTNTFADTNSETGVQPNRAQTGPNLILLFRYVPGSSVYNVPISVQACILYAGT
ncbi:hypothetical protein PENSUB_13528, partial [Penicillium subrubescens]